MTRHILLPSFIALSIIVLSASVAAEPQSPALQRFLAGEFRWTVGAQGFLAASSWSKSSMSATIRIR
jgi:hypothetical protein